MIALLRSGREYMNNESAFNALSFFLEALLFTGIVGTALAVRFRPRKSPDGSASASGAIAPVSRHEAAGELTADELASRRKMMLSVTLLMAGFMAAILGGVMFFLMRRAV